MLAQPPLSLYVHVPWCVRKCPYCDFNSHEAKEAIPQQAYIDSLCKDLLSELENARSRPLVSIFIGGGTPSLLEAGFFARLISFIGDHFELADDVEITLEANPGTAEAERFNAYRELGINRLSIGIQSFDDLQLQKLGRIHDAMQARNAVALARLAGFDNVNIDMMHGLPGQRSLDALRDLEYALQLNPEHLSWYQLTIEPNTAFYSRPPTLPAEPALDEMQQGGQRLLEMFGFSQYEVSAFAREATLSRHNYNYWKFGDYIGVGAGAHGKMSFPDRDRIVRTRRLKQPAQYLRTERDYVAETSEVSHDERSLEYLMNVLRLRDGFSQTEFEAATGLPFTTVSGRIEGLVEAGMLTVSRAAEAPIITASDRGYRMLNSVLEEFL